jgi:FixJ family two-component response regulator
MSQAERDLASAYPLKRNLDMNDNSKSNKAKGPTVYVVDDDDSMRQAIALLLRTVGYSPVVFARPSDFLSKFDPNVQSCAVLDIRMPEMSGLEVQQQLNRSGAMLPVIFITGHGDIPMAVQAMKDGAFDFMTKPFRDQDLLDRINNALKQDGESRATIQLHADLRQRADTLTAREREVLELVVDGKANKVVAIDLGLSERTVEIHRANVMEKMGARSVAHLVKMYLTLNERNA